jgi:CheY-like chemotaxis protein
MHILYVEDEPNDATLVERYIRTTPHQIKIVKNLQEAEQSLSHAFDLILLDMFLNGRRDGFNLVYAIRQRGYTQPIIALTALSLPQDIQQCFESGCTEVISKPFEIADLDRLFRRYTGKFYS